MALFGNALEFPVLFRRMQCTAHPNVQTDPSNRENYFVIWKVLPAKRENLNALTQHAEVLIFDLL